MKITNTFHCSPLSGTLSFNTCLIRRNAKNDRWDGKHKYPLCASCEQGQKIKAKFPDWKYKKNDKRKKPDRINLKKKSGSRAACLKAIDLKPETKGAEMIPKRPIGWWNQENNVEKHSSAPKDKPFNAKLFIQAQKRYIETLMKQGKTIEVRERINLVKSELTERGINHDALQEMHCKNLEIFY